MLQLSDWYSVTRPQVKRNGGEDLFKHYHTLDELLRTVYKDYPWDSTKFVSNPRYWKKRENLVAALDKTEEFLGIRQV